MLGILGVNQALAKIIVKIKWTILLLFTQTHTFEKSLFKDIFLKSFFLNAQMREFQQSRLCGKIEIVFFTFYLIVFKSLIL